MVKITAAALMAVLATASAEHARMGRRHLHPRSYPVAPAPPAEYPVHTPPAEEHTKPAEYPVHTPPAEEHTKPAEYPVHTPPAEHDTYPVHSETKTIPKVTYTKPAPTGYPVHPYPEKPEHPYPQKPGKPEHPYPEVPAPSHAAPYPNGTAHYPVAPKPDVHYETKTVVPIPATTPVAKDSSKPEAPKPYPTHPAPAPAPAPEHSSEVEYCAPVTVYVTAPVDTHTVTAETPVKSYPAETKPAPAPEKPTYEAKPAPPKPAPEKPTYEAKPAPPKPSEGASYKEVSKPKTPSAPGGSKRGIIYKEESNLDQFKSSGKFGWAWNWNGNDFGQNAKWDYVPILNNAQQASTFPEQVKAAISKATSGYVMGPNEPDQVGGGGSGMSVDEAVKYYIQYVAPFEGSAKLGSISITSDQSGGLKGLNYLEAWKKSCDAQGGCPVDFVCLHWYGPTDGSSGEQQAELFKTYVTEATKKVKELYGQDMKVWVTEFGAMPELPSDKNAEFHGPFMKETLPWLDSNADVERYSYFMAAPEYLTNADGSLTAAGEIYCEA